MRKVRLKSGGDPEFKGDKNTTILMLPDGSKSTYADYQKKSGLNDSQIISNWKLENKPPAVAAKEQMFEEKRPVEKKLAWRIRPDGALVFSNGEIILPGKDVNQPYEIKKRAAKWSDDNALYPSLPQKTSQSTKTIQKFYSEVKPKVQLPDLTPMPFKVITGIDQKEKINFIDSGNTFLNVPVIDKKANGGEIKSNTMKKKAVKIKRKGYVAGTPVTGVMGTENRVSGMTTQETVLTGDDLTAYNMAPTQAEKDKIMARAKANQVTGSQPTKSPDINYKPKGLPADGDQGDIGTSMPGVVGMAAGVFDSAAIPIKNASEKTDDDGVLINEDAAGTAAVFGALTSNFGMDALGMRIETGNWTSVDPQVYLDYKYGAAKKAQAQKRAKAGANDTGYILKTSNVKNGVQQTGGEASAMKDGGSVVGKRGKVQKESTGGIIEGKGTKTSDSINAEFNLKDQIINADAMQNDPAAKAVMKHLGLNKKAKLKDGTVPVKVSDGEGHIPAKDVPDAEAYLASIGSSLRQLNPNAEENVQALKKGTTKSGVESDYLKKISKKTPIDKFIYILDSDGTIQIFTDVADANDALKVSGSRKLDWKNNEVDFKIAQKFQAEVQDRLGATKQAADERAQKFEDLPSQKVKATQTTAQEQAIQNAVTTPAAPAASVPIAPGVNPAQWKYDEFKKNYGTDKAAITKLQQELVDKGYDLGTAGPKKNGVDGSLGDKTETAFISNNVKGPDASIGSLIQQDALNTSNANKAIGAKFPPEPVEPDGRSASYDAAILAEQKKPHRTNDVSDADIKAEEAAAKQKLLDKEQRKEDTSRWLGTIGAVSQIGLGLAQAALAKEPEMKIDPAFMAQLTDAQKSDDFGLPPAEATALEKQRAFARKAGTNYATSVAGGNSGMAFGMAKELAGQEADGALAQAVESAKLQMQKKSRTDTLATHLQSLRQQQYAADYQNFVSTQTSGGNLAQAGFGNLIEGKMYRDAQDRMDKRLGIG